MIKVAWFQNAKTGVIVASETTPVWGGEWLPLSTPARKTQRSTAAAAGASAEAGAPPKSASRAAWAKFAESKGIETDGLTRKEIVDALGA